MMPISLYQEGIILGEKHNRDNVNDIDEDLERTVTIILADDDKNILEMLSPKLSERGYNVLSHRDKIAALIELKKIKEQGQDNPLIISDIMSPVTDGFEFFKRARALIPDIKFIFCTAHRTTEYINRARQMGANAYIKKPVELNVLYQSIERVLQGEAFFQV